MSLPRILMSVLIALALVAGGIAPGFAKDMHSTADAALEAPCHDMEGAPLPAEASPIDNDCCDGGDCRCDCLQQTVASVLALRAVPAVSSSRLMARVNPVGHVPTIALPGIRPPIA